MIPPGSPMLGYVAAANIVNGARKSLKQLR